MVSVCVGMWSNVACCVQSAHRYSSPDKYLTCLQKLRFHFLCFCQIFCVMSPCHRGQRLDPNLIRWRRRLRNSLKVLTCWAQDMSSTLDLDPTVVVFRSSFWTDSLLEALKTKGWFFWDVWDSPIYQKDLVHNLVTQIAAKVELAECGSESKWIQTLKALRMPFRRFFRSIVICFSQSPALGDVWLEQRRKLYMCSLSAMAMILALLLEAWWSSKTPRIQKKIRTV